MPIPTLHTVSTHSYDVLGDPNDLIALLDTVLIPLGPPKSGDLYRKRWTHVGDGGRTMVILFAGDPARLAVMGPRLGVIDRLADEEVAK